MLTRCFRALARWAGLLVVGAIAAACTSASLEDAMPGARNTGAYPNLNIAPVSQTDQFSDADQQTGVTQLEAARARNHAQEEMAAESDAARLRQVGATHVQDALRIIEQ